MLQYVLDQIFALHKFEFPPKDSRLYFKTCYALENDASPGSLEGNECSRAYEKPIRNEDAKPRGWDELERLARQPTFLELSEDRGHRRIDGSSTRGIMDLLGWYNPEFPDSVFMCHKNIMAWALESGVPFHCVWDVVCIHELAHLIHHRVNPDQFQAGHPLFPSRADFVEGWAQYCTWIVVQALGGWHETAFNRLVQGQPAEYHYYKLFVHHQYKASVVKLFFCEYGWIETLKHSFPDDEKKRWVPSDYPNLLIAHLRCRAKGDAADVVVKLMPLGSFRGTDEEYPDLGKTILDALDVDGPRDEGELGQDLNDLGF